MQTTAQTTVSGPLPIHAQMELHKVSRPNETVNPKVDLLPLQAKPHYEGTPTASPTTSPTQDVSTDGGHQHAQVITTHPHVLPNVLTTSPPKDGYQVHHHPAATGMNPFQAAPVAIPHAAAVSTLAPVQSVQPTVTGAPQAAGTVAPQGTVTVAPQAAGTVAPQATGSVAPQLTPLESPSSDSATTFGDPHVGNLKGEKFNILNPGTYTFLVVPRGADTDHALLHVSARVENSGPLCDELLFITGLGFRGQWLGKVGSLELLTSSVGLEDMGAEKVIKIRAGFSTANLSLPDFQASAPKDLVEVTQYQPSKPQALYQHATTLLVKIALGPCTSKVRLVYQKELEGYSNSFWLTTTGLQHVRESIGGLLGFDGHQLAAGVPDECTKPHKGDLMRPDSPAGRGTIHALALLSDQDEAEKA